MCYFFLYDICKYGNKCENSHSFNRRALCFYQRYLTKSLVDDVTLMKILRLSASKYSITFCHNRCDGVSCDSLHCCKYQMTGKQCNNSKSTCEHSHSLFDNKDDHNYKLLASKGLNDVNELDLRNYIHDAYYCCKSKLKMKIQASISMPVSSTIKSEVDQSIISHKRINQCVLCKETDNLQKIPETSCNCKYCFICFFQVKFTGKCKIHSN